MKNFSCKILLMIVIVLCLSTGVTRTHAQLTVSGDGADLLIMNATILTITHGIIENGAVLISDGKIAEVGATITPPQNCRLIDASGRYVLPGIIDSHSHMCSEGGINEMSRNIAPEINIQDVIRHDDGGMYRALAGGVTALNTLHGSANPIGGRNAVVKLKFGKSAEEILERDAMRGIKFALGENPKRSGTGPDNFPVSRLGVEYSIREVFTEAKQYMRKWEEYELQKRGKIKRNDFLKKEEPIPPRRDLTMETLADILKGDLGIICHAYRADEMLMLMEMGDEMGFKVGSFEHCLEGYKIAEEIAAHGVIASIFADSWAYKLEAFDAIPYDATILNEHGVIVTINSDSGERIRRLYQDAAKLVKYGMSEEDALKTITLNPAIMLGLENRCGSIEVGKDADIAIFNGHPFSVYSKVEMTLIEGQIYFDLATAKTAQQLVEEAAKTTE